MIASDKLLSLTTLVGCNTAAEHFCSITAGGETRVYGTYGVEYIPTEKSKMKYIVPDKVLVQYVPKRAIDIIYVKSVKQAIKYIVSPTIKIVHKCKP